MTAPIACPDCSEALVESSSERGDYFCPNCTSPVSVQDAIYEWLEESVEYYREEFVNASGEHDAARDLATAVFEELNDGR